MKNFYSVFFISLYLYGFLQSFYMLNQFFSTISSLVGFLLFMELLILASNVSSKLYWKNFISPELFIIISCMILYTIYSLFITSLSFYTSIFMLIKMFTILLLMYYISYMEISGLYLKKILLMCNYLIFSSIILCKLLTGRFSYLSYYGGNEYFGYFQNGHMIGMGITGLAIFQLYNFIKEKNLLYLVIFIIDSCLVYMFKIRTYLLALVVGVFSLFIFNKKITLKFKITVCSVIVIVVTVLLNHRIDLSFLIINRENIMLEGDTFLRSLSSGRTVFWLASIKSFLKADIIRTLFGYGVGGSQMIINLALKQNIGSHNDWLMFLIECGLFGLILYLFYYIRSFNKYIRNSEKEYIISLMLAHITCSIFNGTINYTYSSLIFFFVILYITTNSNTNKTFNKGYVAYENSVC